MYQLAVSRRIVCCSPVYADRAGLPASLDDILLHPCLTYSNSPPSQVWTFQGENAQAAPKFITPRGIFTANNGEVLGDAAVAGHGIAVLSVFIVAPDLAAGRLVRVLPDEVPVDDGVFAVYPRSAFTSQKVRTPVQFLQQAMSPPPWEAAAAPAGSPVPAPRAMPRRG